MSSKSTPVRSNYTAVLVAVAWLLFLGFAGCAIGGASAYFQWGFVGFAIAGLLWLGGVMGLAGMFVGGGSWTAACPSCGGAMKSGDYEGQRKEEKVLRCRHCDAYVMGRTSLVVVPEGHVHARPVFEAPLPERFAWPDGCPTCGEAATRRVKVEGRSAVGTTAMVAAPVGVQRVLVIEVPACDRHDDGVGASRGDGKGDRVQFRSFDYWRRFVAANP